MYDVLEGSRWSVVIYCGSLNKSGLRVVTGLLKKNIFKDFLSVSLIQGLNYLVPLLLMPYVVRRLGPEYYGLVSFSQSFILYFTLIINYGFDLSATREVAKATGDPQKQAEIFNEIFNTKLYLFILTFVIIIICLIFSSKLSSHSELHLVSYSSVIGTLLFPMWYFQGINKLKIATFFNFIFKSLLVISVFLLVKNKEDYLIYNVFFSVSQILLGISSFYYLIQKNSIKIKLLSFDKIKRQIYSGFHVFISMLVINIYTTTNIVFLGFLSTESATGYFSGASKIVTALFSILLMPLSALLYPKIAQYLKLDKEKGIEILRLTIWISTILGIFISISLYLFSHFIIITMFGDSFKLAITTLKILSLLPFLIIVNSAFTIQGLLNFNKDKIFLSITSIGALLSIVFNFLLIPYFNQNGPAITWVVTEIFITISAFFYLKKTIGTVYDIQLLKCILKGEKFI